MFNAWLPIAVIAILGWGAVVAVLRWRHREPPILPGAAEWSAEPAAVVHLVTHGAQLTMDAAKATLLELAVRGAITIDRVGPEPDRAVVRVERLSEPTLTSYQDQVLQHVIRAASDGVAPLGALTTGTDSHARSWLATFRAAVVVDARRRGLTRPRITTLVWQALVTVAAGIGVLAALAAGSVVPNPFEILLGAVTFAGLLRVLLAAQGERLTATGRSVAGRWLGVAHTLQEYPDFGQQPPANVGVWGHRMSYGIALGLAPGTAELLPLGPDTGQTAWSAYGGRWRRLQISYPRRLSWGSSGPNTIFSGLSWLGAAGFVWWAIAIGLHGQLAHAGVWGLLAAIPVGAVGFTVLAWGFVDLFAPIRRQGLVLRLVELERARFGIIRSLALATQHIAVDTGTTDALVAWVLPRRLRQLVAEGDVVQVTVGRFCGRVRSIGIISPSIGISTIHARQADRV